MKQIFKDKIINIDDNIEDNKFLIKKLDWEKRYSPPARGDLERVIKIVFLSELLEERKNLEMLEKSKTKPATYSNVYSPKDELELFKGVFDDAIKNNKKVHIVGITLGEEIQILEEYYKELGFFSEEINAFKVDFSKVLVSVSVKIENLMWKGSDYRRMGKKIFFNPPIRESGEVKNMFKGINRGVTAGIFISPPARGELEGGMNSEIQEFLNEKITSEHILPITMAKVLNYNLVNFGLKGEESDFIIKY